MAMSRTAATTASVFVVLSAGMLLCACDTTPEVDVVLHGATIVDAANERIVADQTIAIDDGRIIEIGTSEDVRARGLIELDATGKYVIPGLVDAHVHVDHPDELNIYPAFGVTSIFVLRGLPQHLAWRAEIEDGLRFGPHLFTTGDYMDGYPPYMQPLMSFDDIEAAQASVREQHEAGYDFVKVYTRLSTEQRAAIIEEAHQIGQCVVGHAGPDTALDDLIELGQDNVAHGQDLIRWYFDSADDPKGVDRIVSALAGSNTTVTPNLSWTTGLIAQGSDLERLLERPVARALHPAILQPFRPANNRYLRNADTWVPEVRARLEKEHEIARRLHSEGVTLLAGTDASTSGVFPGDAMHEELEQLVAAGLSPGEALVIATVNPADFLVRCVDAEIRTGRVAVDHRADLVLLDRNPLEDIRNSREISGVVLAGRWHSRESLEARLDSLDRAYVELREEVINLEKDLFSGRTDDAREIFDRARKRWSGEILFSQYTPFFVGYGFLYGDNGFNSDPDKLRSALELYRMYTETYPQFHSAHYQLGLAQKANGLTDEARRSFEKALEIHAYYPDAKRQLAELLESSGE
ncbi:MAG: amidohydrolase family protein [Rhodothermales bacterium]|nr:amidohydrolase family protein [Rhodothermales bacterium]